jgi:hypothetical protein
MKLEETPRARVVSDTDFETAFDAYVEFVAVAVALVHQLFARAVHGEAQIRINPDARLRVMMAFQEMRYFNLGTMFGLTVFFLKQFGENVQLRENLSNGVWFCDLKRHNV